MEPDDPALGALADEFVYADGSHRWRVFANGGDWVYAWRQPPGSPARVLRDRTIAGLRARMREFERVLEENRPGGDERAARLAMAAAERLDTTGLE